IPEPRRHRRGVGNPIHRHRKNYGHLHRANAGMSHGAILVNWLSDSLPTRYWALVGKTILHQYRQMLPNLYLSDALYRLCKLFLNITVMLHPIILVFICLTCTIEVHVQLKYIELITNFVRQKSVIEFLREQISSHRNLARNTS